MTKPQAGSGVPNEADRGRYFFQTKVKAVWTGPMPDASVDKAFLMPSLHQKQRLHRHPDAGRLAGDAAQLRGLPL